jgi:hypothetical protein
VTSSQGQPARAARPVTDLAQQAMRHKSHQFEKEEKVSGNTELESETQDETEDETQDETEDDRIVQLVTSGAFEDDEGAVVWVHAWEEPWTLETGIRLTGDDAWALSHALGEAAAMVGGREPQAFIQLLFEEDPWSVGATRGGDRGAAVSTAGATPT